MIGMVGGGALRVWLVVATVSVFAAAACSDSPTTPTPVPPPPPPPPPPETLTLTCPAAQSAVSLRNQPVAVSWAAPGTGGGTVPILVICSHASGSLFSAGVTAVTCTATDAGTQSATCFFNVTITRPPQLSVSRFMAFGDSITWGTDSPPAPFFGSSPVSPPATSYPSQLQNLLAGRYLDQTITIVNEGWPGEAIADGLTRLPGAVAAGAPEVLLLLDGANDLLGNPSSATTQYIATRLRDMIRAARGRAPALRVLLATFPPQYHGTIPYDRGAGADFVPELNQRIAAVAQSEGATLVDLYGPLVGDLRGNIGGDGLHPTVKGFTLMAQAFNEVIQRTFEVRPTGGTFAAHGSR